MLIRKFSGICTLLMSGLLVFLSLVMPVQAQELEKSDLTLGFIKLTDMAPFVVATELGYFEDEGLAVTLQAQPNWSQLLDKVVSGELDAAQMLPGQALALAAQGAAAQDRIITPFSMDLNGNAITVSNQIWTQMKPNVPVGADSKPQHPISASSLKPVVDTFKREGKDFHMGMVHPVSTHNYELRYWLAAGGIHPGFYTSQNDLGNSDADVLISVRPPPSMPAALAKGDLDGYSVGDC